MTPEEAIRQLQNSKVLGFTIPRRILMEVTQLGIEALKRHQHNSACFEKGVVKPLPGETEE